MNTPQLVAAVTGTVSAALLLLGLIDPGSIFAKPNVDTAIVAVFASATPAAALVWAYFHHASHPPAP